MGFARWLEDRTGAGALMHEALYERIPGGARWRYVWGSTLVFAFTVQAVTGFALWSAYSPSAQTAWESVYYIQYEMTGGWLLRGVHHYMAQFMVVLLALHFMQVVIDGAYRAPREVNFWLGLVLLKIVLGLALTGYLLPWDQKGYWATSVATSLVGLTPAVGPELQQIVVGGSEYGHHTLTRFFALHAGVLPSLLVAVLVMHLALFRRHGVKAKEPRRGADAYFWPDQVLKGRSRLFGRHGGRVGALLLHAGRVVGPRRPGQTSTRPRDRNGTSCHCSNYWHCPPSPGDNEVIGAIYLPAALMLVVFLMPIIGRWKLGHGFNVLFTFAVFTCAGVLTAMAMRDDANDERYQQAVQEAEAEAERAIELAPDAGHPPPPAPRVSCATTRCCKGRASLNEVAWLVTVTRAAKTNRTDLVAAESSAPNLYRFASNGWLAGLLDAESYASAEYFGNTAHVEGEMAGFLTDTWPELEEEQQTAVVAALAAEAGVARTTNRSMRPSSRLAEK